MIRILLCLLLLTGSAHAADIALDGRVTDSDGTAIAAADVYVNQNRQPQKTTTDADGRFHVGGLEVGRLEVVARKDGLAIGGIEADIVGTAAVAIVLTEPAETRLRVTDKNGLLLEGARIKTMFVSDAFHVSVEDLVPLGFPSYRSDAEGYLVIPDLPKGSYLSLVVERRDFSDFQLVTFPVGKELSLPMTPGRAVRGRILSSDGDPVAKARVSLFRVGSTGKREFDEVLSDPEGFFVATVEPGEYYIAVQHPQHASPPPVPCLVNAEGDEPTGQIQLMPPRFLQGRVEDQAGKAYPGVPVEFVIEQTIVAQTWSQLDGSYQLLIPPRPGRVRVDPPRGYYTDQIITVHMEDKERAEVGAVVLKPLPLVTGQVIDSDNAPLANALITSQNLPTVVRSVTDKAGRFAIALDRLPFEEKLRFRVDHPVRFRRAEFEVDVADTTPLAIELETYKPELKDADPPAMGNRLEHMVDKPAPEWTCDQWFNGGPLALSGLRGKVVVLTLWGGFPVNEIVPDAVREMITLHEVLRGVDDVALVAIHDNGKEPKEIQDMIDKAGIQFPVGRDNPDSVTLDAYNVVFIPQTIVIDKEGKIRYYVTQNRLLDLIKDLRRQG